MAALIKQTASARTTTRNRRAALYALSSLVFLAACSKPAEKVEEIRPVRAIRLAADNVDISAEFPGEVRARVESRLGFRVGGKIISRKIEVGSPVTRGQILMQLDPQDLQLAQSQYEQAKQYCEKALEIDPSDKKVQHRYLDIKKAIKLKIIKYNLLN